MEKREKEYYRVYEISKMNNITSRYVRSKVKELSDTNNYKNRITKDSEGQWLVHHLALENFKRKRKQKNPFYALTVDFTHEYSIKDIEQIIQFVCAQSSMDNFEFHYTIEKGGLKEKNHLHAFTNSKSKTELIKNLRLGFSEISYKILPVYDIEGWRNYMTKQDNKIKTIKNKA